MNGILMAALLLFLQGFPAAPTDQALQNPDSATVEGFVVRIGMSSPVTRARVTLLPEGGVSGGVAATIDGGGKFVFSDVPVGIYRIDVRRDGYVPAEYGQTRLGGVGVPLTLRSSTSATNPYPVFRLFWFRPADGAAAQTCTGRPRVMQQARFAFPVSRPEITRSSHGTRFPSTPRCIPISSGTTRTSEKSFGWLRRVGPA